MSKMFRILFVGMALLGLAATMVACDGTPAVDAGTDSATE